MRILSTGLILIASATAFGQPYTLPGEIFDRMAFDVVRGRACDSLRAKQEIDINAITAELNQQGKIIQLQKSKDANQDAIIQALRDELTSTRDLGRAEKEGLKSRVKRLRAWFIGLVGFDVALLLILLI